MWLPRCDVYIPCIYHLCTFKKANQRLDKNGKGHLVENLPQYLVTFFPKTRWEYKCHWLCYRVVYTLIFPTARISQAEKVLAFAFLVPSAAFNVTHFFRHVFVGKAVIFGCCFGRIDISCWLKVAKNAFDDEWLLLLGTFEWTFTQISWTRVRYLSIRIITPLQFLLCLSTRRSEYLLQSPNDYLF